jgi:hypothetical protein
MGFRFQKRISLFPGIRLNLSKSGASVTVGKPGLSVNLGKDGATGNVGIPGTGLSYREKIGSDRISAQEDVLNQPEQNDQADAGGSGVWKWLFFVAVVVIVVLLAAR